jgi:hypothetical protein
MNELINGNFENNYVLKWLISSSVCVTAAFQVWCKVLEDHMLLFLVCSFIFYFCPLEWKAQALKCTPYNTDLTSWAFVSGSF